MKPARILLADDHALILDAIRSLLKPRYAVLAALENGKDLVEAALRLKPDLVILDITLPLLNGIDAARAIRKHMPEMKLLFVTMHTSPAYLQAALDVGANGFAVKSSGGKEVLTAVKTVLNGGLYIAPAVAPDRLAHMPDSARAAAALRLSAREREILQLIAEGKSRKEIAFAAGISEKTVAFHKTNLKQKLGLSSTAQLTKYAIDEGLIQ